MALHNPPINADVHGETPTGLVDGSNTVFTTAQDYEADSLEVYLNGQRVNKPDDYTETGANTFTLVDAPRFVPGNPDTILVDYTPA